VESDFRTVESLQPGPCKAGASVPTVKVAPEAIEKNLIRRVAAIYPNNMFRTARMEGNIVLDAVISTCGTVTSAVVAEAPGQANVVIFGQSAIIAVKKWTYKPYVSNGHPVNVRTQIVVKVSSDEPDGAVTYPNGPAAP
jgi:TonB family protein